MGRRRHVVIGPQGEVRPRDVSQNAKRVMEIATGQADEVYDPETVRRMGSAGGKARATALPAERRSEIARAAADARWQATGPYITESTGPGRVTKTVDLDRFLIDLLRQFRELDRLNGGDSPYTGATIMSEVGNKPCFAFKGKDYELRFQTGGGWGGPGRVWIALVLVGDRNALSETNYITVHAGRPLTDIAADIRTRLLDHVDELLAGPREMLVDSHRQQQMFERRMERFVADYPKLSVGFREGHWGFRELVQTPYTRGSSLSMGAELRGQIYPGHLEIELSGYVPDKLFDDLYAVLVKHNAINGGR